MLLKYTEGNGGGVIGVGKSKARTYTPGKTGVKFADVAGVDQAKQELQEVVDFLKNSDDGNTSVMLIVATNRPEVLDPALRRLGRFDSATE